MVLSYCGVMELASCKGHKSPCVLPRSIQQAWQLFQNISIKANPVSLNSTLSLLYPVAEQKTKTKQKYNCVFMWTPWIIQDSQHQAEKCFCFKQLSGKIIGDEWMQVYLFKPITMMTWGKRRVSQQSSHHGIAQKRIFTVALQLILLSVSF